MTLKSVMLIIVDAKEKASYRTVHIHMQNQTDLQRHRDTERWRKREK